MDEPVPRAPRGLPREAPPPGPAAAPTPARPRSRKDVVRLVALALVGAVVVAVALRSAGPAVQRALQGLVDVRPWWLLAVLAAQAVSMGAFARQQRRLLAPTVGRRPTMRSVMKTTYAGNAISVSLPLAGPALSTAFTYRRYTRSGVAPGQVATGLAVSGVVSLSAFVATIAVAALASGSTALLVAGANGLVVSAVPMVVLLVVLHSAALRERSVPVLTWVLRLVQRVVRHPRGEARTLVVSALHQLAEAELRPRQVAAAAWFALVNWLADVATFAGALAAVGAVGALSGWPVLVLAWAAGVLAAGVGLVPGGVGVVEVAMTAVLTASGVPVAAALSGVLLYRIVAFWLVIAVGWVLVALRSRRSAAAAGEAGVDAGADAGAQGSSA